LDTICGIFAIDEPTTGSSDPYAVRRATIGVIAMLRTLPGCDLRRLIGLSLDAYQAQGLEFDPEAVAAAVVRFFQARLVAIARDEGLRPDTIEAVSAVGVIDPIEFMARAHALEDARSQSPEVFDDLATAYARAAHLADAGLGSAVDASLLGDAERALLAACDEGGSKVASALGEKDFRAAIDALAELKTPIDRFFDDVLVMDDDTEVRENRLRLLNRFVEVFVGIADIGALSRRK
ncbi:glycine--tRNA ligase subunit beta, partial [Thermophilibacter provencensis]|uniref:glycine--tRNA ligase subunit beta n=1 Tax=Thermophilibacter provencensis TaxID=1852386 RepID=UPI003AA8EFEB